MRLVSETQFLQWAALSGVELDPQWSQAGGTRWLKFQGGEAAQRFWVVPNDPRGLLTFISALLSALDAWETCSVLKREGGWTYTHEQDGRRPLLDALGIPESQEPALEVGAAESPALLLLIMTQLAFGWCAHDDLWLVPDHGKQVFFTDHHGVIHVEFQQPRSVAGFVERMSAAGFELPTEPPDESFRWPAWMGPKPEHW